MRSAISVLSIVFFSSFATLACSGDSNSSTPDAGDEASIDTGVAVEAGPDVDNGAPSSTYPAFKVDAPQVVTGGGPILTTPKVVPVYFANDDTTFTGNVTTFLGKLAASTSYWTPPTTEYGVGAMTIATPVQLTENAPASIDDTAIQTWIAGKMGDPAWPTNDANTLYVLFYPSATTSITLQGQTSCTQFGGYHSDAVSKVGEVSYAVIPRCAKFGGLTGLDAVSATTSHEIIEAATDPQPTNGVAAFSEVDANHIIWMFVLGGGEVADMCAQNQGSFYAPTDIGNYVQRSWSNKSAKAGHNPCLPLDGLPYFNSMPVLTDSLSLGGGQIQSKGVTIPVGQSATIEVDLFSDAPTAGPWQVSAIDTATLQNQSPELKFDWDRTSGQNGEKLHLTITVLKASQYNAEGFMISSRLGARESLWVGLVGN